MAGAFPRCPSASPSPRPDGAGLVTKEVADAMAVTGDHRVDQLDDYPDRRHPSDDSQRPKEGNLLGDPDPCGPRDAPVSVPVPDMDRVEQDLHGRGVDDLIGILKGYEAKAPTAVQPMQEPRRATADTAIGVVEHEETTVGHRCRHSVSVRGLRAASRVTNLSGASTTVTLLVRSMTLMLGTSGGHGGRRGRAPAARGG